MEKPRLRRRCAGCSNIFDVERESDKCFHWKHEPNEPIRVSWTTDPFKEEIYGDFTRMWLCGECWHTFRDDI